MAGTAAALSVKEGIDLNRIDVETLQDKLREQNGVIDKRLTDFRY